MSVTIEGKSIELNAPVYIPTLEENITITKLRFYIGLTQDKLVRKNTEWSYFLIDLENPSSLVIEHLNTSKFCLGIDSITNSSGAHGGDLDPTNDMYWSWQSGYINTKLEGLIGEKEFTLHLGGYAGETNSWQVVSSNSTAVSTLFLDLAPLVKNLSADESTLIMSPSKRAVNFSKLLADGITLK